ncbi:hypothetical protein [Pseudobacteroides cellulosolvens]|uniref:Cohesin domain protein n=1 Tax=Pseudobacteroides cellulosolvens ATCC 35603 = DSM 2933 TaxID=398512 RepID=A0A0L6JI48_9FIRM|nr:Cohesin domain protein [Pseudobacteroides cellulosolvens ATCC 35603 = DSM 2933]
MRLEPYKSSNAAETTGTVGVICFKVLSNSPTSVKFENCALLTKPVNGTMIFN